MGAVDKQQQWKQSSSSTTVILIISPKDFFLCLCLTTISRHTMTTRTTVTMMRPIETAPTTTRKLTRGAGGENKLIFCTHSQTCYTRTWWLRSSGGSDTEWLSIGIHRCITSSEGWSWRGRQSILTSDTNMMLVWWALQAMVRYGKKLVLIAATHS